MELSPGEQNLFRQAVVSLAADSSDVGLLVDALEAFNAGCSDPLTEAETKEIKQRIQEDYGLNFSSMVSAMLIGLQRRQERHTQERRP